MDRPFCRWERVMSEVLDRTDAPNLQTRRAEGHGALASYCHGRTMRVSLAASGTAATTMTTGDSYTCKGRFQAAVDGVLLGLPGS